VKDPNGIPPPAGLDVFKTGLSIRKFADKAYIQKIEPLYQYIGRYWKKNKKALAEENFDLEELFTLLHSQLNEASERNDAETQRSLSVVFFALTAYLAELLSEFTYSIYTSDDMRSFGSLVLREKAVIITFNYDTLLESAIESASGLRTGTPPIQDMIKSQTTGAEPTQEELAFSHHNWNRPLGYGFAFDKVKLYRAGLTTFVEGRKFYSHPSNKLIEPPILKLHGSLNWFRYTKVREYGFLREGESYELSNEQTNSIILNEGNWWLARRPSLNGWLIDPVIIPPVLYKDDFFRQDFVSRNIFPILWDKAKKALEQCRKLVIIGYSFPPTDFLMRKLFLEAFETDHLKELVLVTRDSSGTGEVAAKVKKYCHFEQLITFKSLTEFLQANGQTPNYKGITEI
jgi:hypothetical protein